MAELEFKDLALDIKRLIFSYITRPTDLKNLCLTSKDAREVATPQLYRSIQLLVGGSQDQRLAAMLRPSNPGLCHIRKICVRLEKWAKPGKQRPDSDGSPDEDEKFVDNSICAHFAQFTVRLMLEYLPEDTLESFTWQPWDPISNENYLLLCKKQKKLTVLDVGPMSSPLDPLLAKSSAYESLTSLKRIDLYPDSLDRLKASQRLLQAHPGIETLHVCTGFEYNRNETTPDDLYDTSTRPGLITRTLFSHMLPFESCKPYALKYLVLDDLEVRHAADTWLKIVKFSNLEKLVIVRCAGADAVFTQLSKPHLRPSKLKILRWLDDDKSESHMMETFEGFIEGISSLETLNVWVSRMDSLPNVGAIIQHKRTLKSLAVHSRMNKRNHHTYDEESFNRLCNECTEIRQLSIMFPELSSDEVMPSVEFKNYVDISQKLRNLVTLNIRRWPSSNEPFTGSYKAATQTLGFYEHQLQRLTQRIFESSDADACENGYGLGNRSNLSMIAWGPPGRSRRAFEERYRLKQIPFVRGTVTDAFGVSSLHAIKTIWRLITFIEPESDILQHSLYDLYEPEEGLVFERS